MIYSTRRKLSNAVIREYNRTVKAQNERLYTCKAWVL